ncbi:hypothetical protein Tco_0927195 [Tanacetum coccineum]
MIRIRDDIPKEDMLPQRRFILTVPPPGCDVGKSSAAAARVPRGQHDFVDTIEARHGLICSPDHDASTIAKAADRVEDVGYVRALQASKFRMMTSIEEVNLRVSYQAQVCRKESEDFYTQLLDARTDRRDIRLEIDVVRVKSSPVQDKEQTTPKDSSNYSSYDRVWRSKETLPILRLMQATIWVEDLEGLVKGNDVAAYTQRFQELALMCTIFLADETEKIDKYISGLPDSIHGNVMSARPKTS